MESQAASSRDTSDLLIQQGPSCWLFVVEAVAAAKARAMGLTTNYLRMAMYAYPDSDEVEEERKKKQGASRRRTVALELAARHLGAMVTALNGWKARGGPRDEGDQIAWEIVERYARKNLTSTESMNYLTFDDDTQDVNTVIAEYTKAKACADGLYDLALKSGEKEEAHALLNTGESIIGKDDDLGDVGLSVGAQQLPVYAGICRRFKLSRDQRNAASVDCTATSMDEMGDTSHAVMIVGYDEAGGGKVTYKDPNYGNVRIVISVAQFRAMCGKYTIEMRPFLTESARRSALAKVLGT